MEKIRYNKIMKEETKKIKNIISKNKDKRILILGTKFSGKKEILKELKIGEYYQDVLNNILKEKYGYCYVSSKEIEEVKKEIRIKNNIPMFSDNILDCDIIIFLNVNEKVLKLKATMEYLDASSSIWQQKNLKKELKNINTKVMKIDVLPKKIYPEKMSRNVIVCGKSLKNKIGLMDKKEDDLEYYEKEGKLLIRFPYISYIDTLNEGKRKQGFLLIVEESLLPDNIIEIDRKYRSIFKQFNLIFIVTEDEKKYFKQNKYARITYYPKYFILSGELDDDVKKKYYDYILHFTPRKFQKRKIEELEKIKIFLKNKKTIKTEELQKEFKISSRQVERIMNDLNDLYKNIGYDYTNNEWYIL